MAGRALGCRICAMGGADAAAIARPVSGPQGQYAGGGEMARVAPQIVAQSRPPTLPQTPAFVPITPLNLSPSHEERLVAALKAQKHFMQEVMRLQREASKNQAKL